LIFPFLGAVNRDYVTASLTAVHGHLSLMTKWVTLY